MDSGRSSFWKGCWNYFAICWTECLFGTELVVYLFHVNGDRDMKQNKT
jgi:hypothetical protein